MKGIIRGIVRKVDRMGRIVIPKEILKILSIHDGDPVEIGVEDKSIHIKKYHVLQNLCDLCELCLQAYVTACGGACIICSTDYVLAAKNISVSGNTQLNDVVRNYIRRIEPYCDDTGSSLQLFEGGKYYVATLYPVGSQNEPLGAVVLPYILKAPSPKQLVGAKMIAIILSELTKNS